MLKILSRSKILSLADVGPRRQAKADELRWQDASGIFTVAAGFAVAVLTILTFLG